MTISNNLNDDKEKERCQIELLTSLEITRTKNALTDKQFDDEKEFIQLRKKRRSLAVTLFLVTFVCSALLLAILALHETRKIRGMNFAFRNESLPVSAPGVQQIRAINTLYSNKERGLRAFTPFNSASQTPGELRMVTNYTNPCYLAYVVRHPEIKDVVIITDAFFCSPTTCFYVRDVHNDTFFYKPVTDYRDLTHNLIQVPLPVGSTFIKAESCGHLYFKNCNILLRTAAGHQKFAVIVQDTVNAPPVIEFKTDGDTDDYAWLPRMDAEIRAFRATDDRLVIWMEGQIAIISHEQSSHVDENPIHLTVRASIYDVDRDEIIEMLSVSNNRVLIVLVMKRLEEMKTRVRIQSVTGELTVVRYDELTLLNRPSAIAILERDKTFEICELAVQELKCYSNMISKLVG